jgi:hypothetical protein
MNDCQHRKDWLHRDVQKWKLRTDGSIEETAKIVFLGQQKLFEGVIGNG